jgi:hypothetical protein
MARKRLGTRQRTLEARAKVWKAAKRKGYITNHQAELIGGWNQAYYHLAILERAGLLRREAYNRWVPV